MSDITEQLRAPVQRCWCYEMSAGEPVDEPHFRCEECSERLQGAAEIERLRLELEAVRQASHDSMWRDTLVPLAEAAGVSLVGPDGNKRQFQMVEDLAAEYERQQAESRERALEYVSLDGQYMELSDELAQLRALVAAWADADLGRLDMTRPNEDLNAAVVALRRAVGR